MMMTDRRRASLICLGVALLLSVATLAGCASDKGPAEAAIKAAEEAVSATVAEAGKYVPDQAKSLQAALAAIKEKFAKGEYTGALNDARSLDRQDEGGGQRRQRQEGGAGEGVGGFERRHAEGAGRDQGPGRHFSRRARSSRPT